MGTWGDGLFDNDSAGDGHIHLGRGLVRNAQASPEDAAASLAVAIRLRCNPDPWVEVVADVLRRADDLDTQRAFRLARPPWVHRPLNDELVAITGWAEAPEWPVALAALPGVAERNADWGRRMGNLLVTDLPAASDLYELASNAWPLGVFALVPQYTLTPDQARQLAAAIDSADAATTEERPFWGRYLPHLRGALALARQ